MKWKKDNFKKDTFGWWDYLYDELVIAAYKQISENTWEVLWWRLEHEYLPVAEYTEAEVRRHIELKYLLLRGES